VVTNIARGSNEKWLRINALIKVNER
jgi:hypothetical protein